MPYDKNKAKVELEKIGFKTYDGKHGESIFTKIFSGILSSKKFNIDKRKAHLSSLILSNQISRERALEILKTPSYDSNSIDETIDYICSKLEISRSDFSVIMNGKNRHYSEFKIGIIKKGY